MTIAEYIAQEKQKLKLFSESVSIQPHLVIIQANENEGSNIYIRGKIGDCEEVGFRTQHIRLPVSVTEEDLLKVIDQFNQDTSVHGVIVQVPLPDHIDPKVIRRAVVPSKDVDGFHPLSNMLACTPKGIIDYLDANNFDFVGKHAVIIGRSFIVGRPLFNALLDRHCTVSMMHSKTTEQDALQLIGSADLLVVAIGKKWYISQQKLKTTAMIIDVGISRVEGGLFGDVKPGRHVALQTPVPGGVGLLTRLSLLKNLKEAYQALTSGE
jgi:methylenetetrahydrofolate dehydrogenase (NADP+)/methenyltetrahydrofolate cyclohydrolase